MRILGIETSCDETSAAVVEDGHRALSNVIASQIDIHARYGGIVPEVASRQHILSLVPTIQQALQEADVKLEDLDGVAVTYGPGLAGSLMVGVNAAKAVALAEGLPLVGINHLEAHIYAAWLMEEDPEESLGFPLMCLIASGGHTDLVLMEDHGRFTLLGRTRDDAAGEAFDKVGRILGLGFPGGPAIQKVSAQGRGSHPFPRPMLRDTLDFSFSGLKTAVLRRAEEAGLYPSPPPEGPDSSLVADMAAAFQEAIVGVMVGKTVEAATRHETRGILLVGGVAANSLLRQEMKRRAPCQVLVPPPILCTDNGAMIAAAGYHHLSRGQGHGLDLDVVPGLSVA